MRAAASRTFWTAGSSRPMRMAMMAITTSNSISVKARRGARAHVRMRLMGLLTVGQKNNKCGHVHPCPVYGESIEPWNHPPTSGRTAGRPRPLRPPRRLRGGPGGWTMRPCILAAVVCGLAGCAGRPILDNPALVRPESAGPCANPCFVGLGPPDYAVVFETVLDALDDYFE